MKIAFLGFGAITHDILEFLAPEIRTNTIEVLGACVRGNLDREASIPLVTDAGLSHLVHEADLVIECAGVSAARQHGPTIIAAGTPLVLTSVGALADTQIATSLLSGPGQLIVTNGAIGGLDALEATAMCAGFEKVSIETTKFAPTLVQEWMTQNERVELEDLRDGESKILFTGSPREAIEKFPGNVNVAVALAWATRDRTFPSVPGTVKDATLQVASLAASLERVEITLVASGTNEPSSHSIAADSPAGTYRFTLQSSPSQANPRSSALTAMSVTRDIRAYLAA